MAKNLTLLLKNKEYAAAPVKIDRKKLYGWTETIALDESGGECSSVTMDETGTLLIPPGGIGLAVLDPELRWVERSSLKAVTADGSDAPLIPSSYDEPIKLDTKAGVNEVLDHTISSVYQLGGDTEDLAASLGEDIYTFTYSYRSDYEGSTAFLLAQDKTVFLLIGFKAGFEYLSLEEAVSIEEAAEEESTEDDDEIDFSMM
jgi:hypothetical protein